MMSSAIIDSDLGLKIARHPEQDFNVIVQIDGDPNELIGEIEAHGMVIYRRYRLFPALAITGQGECLVQLADNPLVRRIEADDLVRAC